MPEICLSRTKDETREKLLKTRIVDALVETFKSHNDAIKYCSSRALLTLDKGCILNSLNCIHPIHAHPGDAQSKVPAKDVISWLAKSSDYGWRRQRTIECLFQLRDGEFVLYCSAQSLTVPSKATIRP